MGPVERGFVREARLKVRTLLLVMVAGKEGKLLRLRMFRLGVRGMVEKEGLVTEAERNSVGKVKSMLSR